MIITCVINRLFSVIYNSKSRSFLFLCFLRIFVLKNFRVFTHKFVVSCIMVQFFHIFLFFKDFFLFSKSCFKRLKINSFSYSKGIIWRRDLLMIRQLLPTFSTSAVNGFVLNNIYVKEPTQLL